MMARIYERGEVAAGTTLLILGLNLMSELRGCRVLSIF